MPDNWKSRYVAFACAQLLAFMLLVFVPHVRAQEAPPLQGDDDFNKGGRTAFQFLKIDIGARQAALGGAAIAAVRDVNSVFWNPAGISGIASTEASFSYVRWLADMNYVAGAVGHYWQGIGTFALSVASLNYGAIEESLVSLGGRNDTRTGNTFSGGDLLVGLTYSRQFTDRLAVGIGAKFLRESLWNYAANSYAFDVGTNYDIGFMGTRLAMSVQNYSPRSVHWLENSNRAEGYDMPLIFRVGMSTHLIGPQSAFIHLGPAHELMLAAEAINTNDFGERLHFGGEYRFAGFLALRGGYRINYAEGNWTFGLGLHPELADMEVRIDYAYAVYEFLGAPHRLTMSLAF